MSPEAWREVEEFYHAALERDSGDRIAFLDHSCPNEEVRREVKSLLLRAESDDWLLEESDWKPKIGWSAIAGTESPSLSAEMRVGPFAIISVIGAGGMGEVYRARDSKLHRDVALKVLPAAFAHDHNRMARLEQEARVLASLNHPNIAAIYGLEEAQDLRALVMELVEGPTLAERIGGQAMDLAEALEIGKQISVALEYAHNKGVIHRDLKPANVKLTPDGIVKLLDFGLAKALETPELAPAVPSDSPSITLERTQAGEILGTAAYMAPEQAQGKPADRRADIWAFGVVLYEMLTGKQLYTGDSGAEILASVLEDTPNLEGLSIVARDIVDRCLIKDPGQRWQSIGDVRIAIEEATPSAPRFHAKTSRRRAIWLGAAAAVGAASSFTTWKLWPPHTIRLAVLPFENATKGADTEFLCMGITDSLIRKMTLLKPLVVKRAASFKDKNIDPQIAGRQLGVESIVRGSVTRRLGRLYITAELVDVRTGGVLWGGRYDRAEGDLQDIQDEIAGSIISQGIRLKLSGDDRQRVTRRPTTDTEAYQLFLRSRNLESRETEADYLSAREFLEKAIEKDRSFALAYAALAGNYAVMAMDGYARPAEAWPQVVKNSQRALALDPTITDARLELGAEACWNQWNWKLAEREFEAAALMPAPFYSLALMTYALEQWAVGRPKKSLHLIEGALSLDPLNPQWRLRKADILVHIGRAEQAAEVYSDIIHDEASDPRAYFGLAELRNTQGRFDDAIAQLRLAYQAVHESSETLLAALSTARGAEGYRKIMQLDAEAELLRLADRADANHYVSPLDWARTNARLGYEEQAFKFLDAAFMDRSPGLMFLQVDPAWAAIKDDRRFNAAIKRIGLPQRS